MQKHWISHSLALLFQSLNPVPNEINEVDWKASLSSSKERLTEHLIAFANLSQGGFLVFGIQDFDAQLMGVDRATASQIIATLVNLGRDAIEPPLALDHSIEEVQGKAILLVFVPSQASKPVHRRGRPIDETWIRSGGTTRKASRQEVGALMLNSHAPRWEELHASVPLKPTEIVDRLELTGIAKLLERQPPTDDEGLMQWLVDEKMTVADGTGYCITNFGAIAAARNMDQFEGLKRNIDFLNP